MSDWLSFLLAVFATYRVAMMLALEEGPLGIFDTLRLRLDPEQKTWLGRGVNCPLCIGFWVSLAVSVVLSPWSGWQSLLLDWLGVAGAMAALYLWIDK